MYAIKNSNTPNVKQLARITVPFNIFEPKCFIVILLNSSPNSKRQQNCSQCCFAVRGAVQVYCPGCMASSRQSLRPAEQKVVLWAIFQALFLPLIIEKDMLIRSINTNNTTPVAISTSRCKSAA